MADVNAAIERLERLEKAATPGPWEFIHGHDGDGDSCDILVKLDDECPPDCDPEHTNVLFDAGDRESSNWDLIAAARNALPALIACAKALHSAKNVIDRAYQTFYGSVGKDTDLRSQIDACLEALSKAVPGE